MKTKFSTVILAGVFSTCLYAQASGEPDVSGNWVDSANGSLKWMVTEKDGKIHVQEMNGEKVEADYTCPLNGQECPVSEEGRHETVMIYYNGDKLVEIRERGGDTLKRRISLSPDGKTMQVERVPLSPTQKSETLTFQRQASAGTSKS